EDFIASTFTAPKSQDMRLTNNFVPYLPTEIDSPQTCYSKSPGMVIPDTSESINFVLSVEASEQKNIQKHFVKKSDRPPGSRDDYSIKSNESFYSDGSMDHL
ncbi:hypothetical protein NPIL_322191, partial [Nephila pilipes]